MGKSKRTKIKKDEKIRIMRPKYTLSDGHPDYNYKYTPPRVNLICVDCLKIYRDIPLKGDLKIEKKSIDKKRFRKYKYWLDSFEDVYYKTMIIYDEEGCLKHTEGRAICGRHRLRRLHRLNTMIPSMGKYPHRHGTVGICLNIDTEVEEEILICDHGIFVRTLMYDGGNGIALNEYMAHPIQSGICFLPRPPLGFEPTPIEEMDEKSIDKMMNGLLQKSEEKWKKAVSGEGRDERFEKLMYTRRLQRIVKMQEDCTHPPEYQSGWLMGDITNVEIRKCERVIEIEYYRKCDVCTKIIETKKEMEIRALQRMTYNPYPAKKTKADEEAIQRWNYFLLRDDPKP